MKTREEIEERLRVLTQAYHLSYIHRGELTGEALAKFRALEECISLLKWCLEDSESPNVGWRNVGVAVPASLGLIRKKLFGGEEDVAQPSREATHTPATPSKEVTR